MEQSELKSFNKAVRSLEKHREITIVYDGEKVNTVFERYLECNGDFAEFILHSYDKHRRYKIHCDFFKGKLFEASTGKEIVVKDIFSARYLRGLIFAGQEVLIQRDNSRKGSFTAYFHKRSSSLKYVPVMVTELSGDYIKKWQHVGKIDVSPEFIRIEGLMTVHNTELVASIPVKAVSSIQVLN